MLQLFQVVPLTRLSCFKATPEASPAPWAEHGRQEASSTTPRNSRPPPRAPCKVMALGAQEREPHGERRRGAEPPRARFWGGTEALSSATGLSPAPCLGEAPGQLPGPQHQLPANPTCFGGKPRFPSGFGRGAPGAEGAEEPQPSPAAGSAHSAPRYRPQIPASPPKSPGSCTRWQQRAATYQRSAPREQRASSMGRAPPGPRNWGAPWKKRSPPSLSCSAAPRETGRKMPEVRPQRSARSPPGVRALFTGS